MRESKVIRLLVPLLKIYPWGIPVTVILGILASLSEGIGISLFIPLLQGLDQSSIQTVNQGFLISSLNDLFTEFEPKTRLVVIAIGILASILIKNAISYANMALFSWLNSRISHHLRSGIFKQLLSVNYAFLEEHELGKLLNILATESWQASRALAVLVDLIITLCTISVFVLLLLLISWKLTLVVGAAMLLISLSVQLTTHQVKQLGQQAVDANSTLSVHMWEGLGGMQVIRAFVRELYEQARFNHASKRVSHVFLKLELISGLVNPLYEVASAVLLLCILVAVLWQDQSNLPSLLTFIFVLYRLQPKIKQLDGDRVGLVGVASSVEAVMTFLDSKDKTYTSSGTVVFDGLQQGVRFEDVTFLYGSSDKPALHNISITIPKGKTTAIVGPSGAGKSTLINLVCRFYDPTAGEIYVDGRPIHQLDLSSWRNRIAIVSQNVHIFSSTVRENIAYGRLEATEAEIIEAAKLANAHEFISEFPQGYDTKVGDRGVRLSGGQQQRISLARAIVRDPDILILDEATNALDSISEHLIQEALNTLSKNRTVIVIAHRLATIQQADQILVLKEGRVIEQGNVQKLLKLDGLFAQLYRLQFQSID